MYEARVIDGNLRVVTAFSGVEFVQYEWRPVPATVEESDLFGQPFLEVRERGGAEPVVVEPEPEPEAVAELEPEPAPASLPDVDLAEVFGAKIAGLLVAAGFDSIEAIDEASDDALVAISGIGAGTVSSIRKKLK